MALRVSVVLAGSRSGTVSSLSEDEEASVAVVVGVRVVVGVEVDVGVWV